jgi:hypothetical protein
MLQNHTYHYSHHSASTSPFINVNYDRHGPRSSQLPNQATKRAAAAKRIMKVSATAAPMASRAAATTTSTDVRATTAFECSNSRGYVAICLGMLSCVNFVSAWNLFGRRDLHFCPQASGARKERPAKTPDMEECIRWPLFSGTTSRRTKMWFLTAKKISSTHGIHKF